ncbi:hypothetical protein HDC92_004166 [Pedobacter sp. AK017]|uniref:heme-binding domain-containing protein n=1 Tax=Pedobacter sp. AK017 TaxID=2723073 RepID=UPI001811E299|nr:heme-binding domain-containing protein [Pedobacter sp. AK017]MBB5440465.1 hypothetical protein [Pedobacter sp. AK017]
MKIRILLVFCTIVCGLAQLYRPVLENPPVTGEINAPENVKAILKRACYDCHSNQTDLRWFDKLQPAYALVSSHVRDGRAGLNFSNWDSLAKGNQKAKLFESINQVISGAMPLKSYTLVHRSAKLSHEDVQVLKNYVSTFITPNKPGDTAKINALNRQYTSYSSLMPSVKNLPKTLNGITFMPDYKNWVPISTTQRFDNGTMRVILGNDVAIKAIKQGKTNPWPDGTVLAKVAWDQMEDEREKIETGEFKQVEFMIKDREKYKDTKGWGWARFKTPEFLAYGKTVSFTTECVNCHRPVGDNDYVFTVPVKNISALSKGRDGTQLKLFSSFIDKKQQTMSSVYLDGNKKRIITWKQKDDLYWYGAKVPGELISVKQVKSDNFTSRGSVMP